MANTGLSAVTGGAAKNKGGTHGGINPAGAGCDYSHTTEGSSGNPGTELPWEGADANAVGATTKLPALPYLGGSGGTDLNPAHP